MTSETAVRVAAGPSLSLEAESEGIAQEIGCGTAALGTPGQRELDTDEATARSAPGGHRAAWLVSRPVETRAGVAG